MFDLDLSEIQVRQSKEEFSLFHSTSFSQIKVSFIACYALIECRRLFERHKDIEDLNAINKLIFEGTDKLPPP